MRTKDLLISSGNGEKQKRKLPNLSWLICICLIFNSFVPQFVSAQQIPVRHFTQQDGLPSQAVRSIYKDSRGLIWIGTGAGLCSYDGKVFRLYTADEGMTANQVWAIEEDEEGYMWFGSYGDGVYKYDGRKFKHFTAKEGLVGDQVRVLCYSKKFKCIVVGAQGGISTIKDDSVTTCPVIIPGLNRREIVTAVADAGDFIYATTYSQVSPFRYFPDKNNYYSVNDQNIRYPKHSFSTFISSRGDTLFSLENKGIWMISGGEILKNDTLGQIFWIDEDRRGDYWMASWSYQNMNSMGGVYRYDGKAFRNYKSDFGITDRAVWTVYCDREQDILWIGTLNEGLYVVPYSSIKRYDPEHFGLEKEKFSHLFLDPKNRLWISGTRELIRMDTEGDFNFMDKYAMLLTLRNFWNDKRQKSVPELDTIRMAARKIDISKLREFEKRNLFNFRVVVGDGNQSVIYANEFGVFHQDEKTARLTYIGCEGIMCELDVNGDTLIYGGWGPTWLYPGFRQNRIGIDTIWNFHSPPFIGFSKENEPREVVRIKRNGNRWWFASKVSGLWMSEGMRLTNFNKSDSTISQYLKDICFDEYGHVIFGSNTGEICIASLEGDALKIHHRITSEQGLLGSTISWLVADKAGHLWVGTNHGLNCIDLDTLFTSGRCKIRFMDKENGYTGQTSDRALIDSTGNLWVAAGDHLLRIDTRDYLSARRLRDKIFFKFLEINNLPSGELLRQIVDPLTGLMTGKLSVPYSENDLTFYFDILNYSDPSKDRFRYMLEGYDETWHQWESRRRALFTNLPPGHYKLKVESYNLQSLEQAVPLEIPFTIRQPWWGFWNFQVPLLILLPILAGFTGYRIVKREREKQKREAETEKKIVQLEMQALQAQMNPHFIFNTVNGIQYYVLANKMEEVLTYLSDFSKVIGESLANATLSKIPLEQEIEFLRSYLRLELMRFPDKFEFEVTYSPRLDAATVMLPPMLVQPFAENAIRHGFMALQEKGLLVIEFEEDGHDVLKCSVTDNGIGRVNARMREGSPQNHDRPHSATITESRIRLFNQPETPAKYRIVYTDLYENGNPCGLKVELFVPMDTAKG